MKTPPQTESTIMVIDDTAGNLHLLDEILSDGGYRAALFPSGEMGLAAAPAIMPDLILLDIMMPGADGYTTCGGFKADTRLKDIPVIFISALSQSADKVKAFAAGGVDYVSKPFQPEEVLARVAIHLKLRRQRLQIEAQEAELRLKINDLRTLEKQRDELVHMIAHDMRAPLTSALMATDILQQIVPGLIEAGSSEKEREMCDKMLHAIKKASERLRVMIGSFLDVSRMESEAMPLSLEYYDLHKIVERLTLLIGPRLRDEQLLYKADPEPIMALCDGELVLRVLQNLIDNAINHAGLNAKIELMLRKEAEEVRVEVKDNGRGIPPEDQRAIFDKFNQVSMHRRGINLGSGLGLTFCKLAVESQGGRIGLTSEVGQGSTFWFTLPGKHAGVAG